MRSEEQMLDLILNTAREDERIRAAILNGSRANPNAPRDIFQDFDVVYLVTEVAPFRDDAGWIGRFGEIMILQTPDAMGDPLPNDDGSFAYLMQFADGNRIDLTLFPIAKLAEFGSDSLSVLLLDKDGMFEPFLPPSESDYLPKPPMPGEYADCCNEFWWVCAYAAKGLWREETVYAKYMLDNVVREQLVKMLEWHIGVKTGFSRNPGKFGKHFRQYLLAPELWELLQQTYADAGDENTWDALLAMCDLFRRAARPVGEHFDYPYPHDDDRRVSAHLKHVRSLPKVAKQMY
jgi:aminoglycoside 6-adenylyltransferase